MLGRVAGHLAILAGALVFGTRLVIMLTTPSDLAGLKTSVLGPVHGINSVVSIVAFAVLLLAVVALYERQGDATGRFGLVALGGAVIGTVFMAGDWWYEAFAVPWMADVAPVVFETGAAGRLLIGGLTSFFLFGLGWLLFGAATVRAAVFPRALSILLLVTGVLAAIPVAGAYLYGSLAFGLVLVVLGGWLMRPANATLAIRSAPAV
jgi:hypothetical protein